MFRVLLIALVLITSNLAHAQVTRPDDLTPRQRELAVVLARVAFNEALDSEADLELIAQITLSRGETAAERLAWLRRHSPCVTGRLSQEEAYQRPGNCAWTRNLRPDGRLPRGFTAPSGVWRQLRPRWLAHLERAIDYVRAPQTADICPVTPHSWDGKRYGRDRIEARGFRILECGDEAENYAVVRSS